MDKIQVPFFCINPKGYLFGKELIDLAKVADELATRYKLTIFFTVPFTEAHQVISKTKNLIITSQHMDGILSGRGMGHIFPESLVSVGIQATFLNHAEHPMTYHELEQAVKRAKDLDILTIVCANSVTEGKAVALLEPTIIVCEPTELIGSGTTSDDDYMEKCNSAIKEVSPKTMVLQAAGISTVADVRKALESGADGTGGTSGIVCSESPEATLREMIRFVSTYKGDKR